MFKYESFRIIFLIVGHKSNLVRTHEPIDTAHYLLFRERESNWDSLDLCLLRNLDHSAVSGSQSLHLLLEQIIHVIYRIAPEKLVGVSNPVITEVINDLKR